MRDLLIWLQVHHNLCNGTIFQPGDESGEATTRDRSQYGSRSRSFGSKTTWPPPLDPLMFAWLQLYLPKERRKKLNIEYHIVIPKSPMLPLFLNENYTQEWCYGGRGGVWYLTKITDRRLTRQNRGFQMSTRQIQLRRIRGFVSV